MSQPQPREALLLFLPSDVKDALRQRALEERRSMTRTIQVALERYLKRSTKEHA